MFVIIILSLLVLHLVGFNLMTEYITSLKYKEHNKEMKLKVF